jgi:SWI/SNF-related matrix-associated actin-dependent regulator of chromatin subfamily A-like protein 1
MNASHNNLQADQVLTFHDGKFLFQNVSSIKLRKKLREDPFWKSGKDDSFETKDLGAARKLRAYADHKVEKLFKRTFQEKYGSPVYTATQRKALQALDPHQRTGIEWILSRKRSYLAHAPGAGKTAEAIVAACLSKGSGQTLFIVPPSLTLNWEREIWKFTELLGIFPTIGMVRRSDDKESVAWKADFIICPDSMLTKPWVYGHLLEIVWKFIAVDEASRLKEAFTHRSLAFYGGMNAESRYYRGLFRDAKHVTFLDGSPMPNRPIELWAPTYALDPESIDCRSYDDFGYRYCGAKPNEFGQWEYLYSSNEEELKAKLQRSFMHVVTEDELEHPERRRSMLVMDEDVRTFEQKTWERNNFPRTFQISEDLSQGDMAHFRKELGIRKVRFISNYVRDRITEKNESILLFVWHRTVALKIWETFNPLELGIVIGGTPATMREDFFRKFQKGEIKLLVMNILAGGRGHNLQRADRVIFGEFSWTDELNKQAEKRASRKGSKKKFVRCEYIVCPNSMDERILSSIFSKERRVKKVIG